MKYIYVVHNNEYSDSENFGAFTDEKVAINKIKKLNKHYFSDEMKHDHSLKLEPFKDSLDGTISFNLNTTNPEVTDINGKPMHHVNSAEYDYDKIPLNSSKGLNKKIREYKEW